MAKPTALKFTGRMIETRNDKGDVIRREPERFYQGVPARNLDEADIAALDARRLKEIMAPQADGSKPLYEDASPEPEPEPKPEPKAAAAAAKETATKAADSGKGDK
jgi:hypothetical protein